MAQVGGGYSKYTSAEKNLFAVGGDAWNILSISGTMELVLDEHGFVKDVWDSHSKKTYDSLGNETGTRETSFVLPPDAPEPEDMSDDTLRDTLKSARWDYSKESRSIRHQQKALNGKEKYILQLRTELNKRESLERYGHTYLRRRPRISLGRTFSGFRSRSIRSYQRFYTSSRVRA